MAYGKSGWGAPARRLARGSRGSDILRSERADKPTGQPSLNLIAPFTPIPQGDLSWGPGRNGGKGHAYHSNGDELKPYREAVGMMAKAKLRGAPAFDGPLSVDLLFVIPRKKTVTRELPTVPPDLDKLTRAVFDALTLAKVWADDALVVDLSAHKRYGRSGAVHLTIRESPSSLISVQSLLTWLSQSARFILSAITPTKATKPPSPTP